MGIFNGSIMKIPLDEVHEIKKEYKHDPTSGYFKRHLHFLMASFKKLITQGLTPQKVAIGFAVGFLSGTFPIIGTHAVFALLFAFLFRLNHITVFLGVWASIPLYVLMLFPALRLGEFLLHAEPMNAKIFMASLQKMAVSWSQFTHSVADYGESILHIVIGWFPMAVILGILVYVVALRLAVFVFKHKEFK